jgi:Tfp pilus assembly protein PilV
VRHDKEPKRLDFRKLAAFTFVEVLLALSIVLIGLTPVLHLLIKSISVMDSAQCLSQATVIGGAKLAEFLSEDTPETGTARGRVEDEGCDLVFEWEVNVVDESLSGLEEINLSGLRKIDVTVMWREGIRLRQIALSTYVYVDQTVIQTTSERQSTPP